MKPHQLTPAQAAALIARLLESHSQAALTAAIRADAVRPAKQPEFTIITTGGTDTWLQ